VNQIYGTEKCTKKPQRQQTPQLPEEFMKQYVDNCYELKLGFHFSHIIHCFYTK